MNPSLPRLLAVVLLVLVGTAWTVAAYVDSLNADPLGPLAAVEESDDSVVPVDEVAAPNAEPCLDTSGEPAEIRYVVGVARVPVEDDVELPGR